MVRTSPGLLAVNAAALIFISSRIATCFAFQFRCPVASVSSQISAAAAANPKKSAHMPYPRSRSSPRCLVQRMTVDPASAVGGYDQDANRSDDVCPKRKESTTPTSKRSMMKFAIPALGIYLCNPLLSNIDNAFVGRTVGTSGLAALSPGTLCTDQLLYLFSFLARATTGLVSRAYAITDEDRQDQGNTEAARRAASAPLTVSIICGMILSVFYALFTPNLLAAFNVRPSLRPAAASYIYWRGSVAWASLAQKNMLSVLMATRDAVTPLKIVVLASLFNVLGDAALCVWPAQWGCAGAAAATAGATLLSSAIMLRALRTKGLLPEIRVPRRAEMSELLEFTGPLLAITLTRLAGFIVMQRSAAKLGVAPLAAYQLCVNLLLFFLLFGEPLSQLSQTKLPSLIDSNDTDAVSGTLRSILSIAAFTSLSVGAVAFFAVEWGTRLFSTDTSVLALVQRAAPSLFCAIATSIFTVAVDGAMLASRDFGFMLSCGLGTFMAQIYLLHNHCTSIGFVFGTFTMRLGVYAVAALVRSIGMGRGNLGSVLHKRIPTS